MNNASRHTDTTREYWERQLLYRELDSDAEKMMVTGNPLSAALAAVWLTHYANGRSEKISADELMQLVPIAIAAVQIPTTISLVKLLLDSHYQAHICRVMNVCRSTYTEKWWSLPSHIQWNLVGTQPSEAVSWIELLREQRMLADRISPPSSPDYGIAALLRSTCRAVANLAALRDDDDRVLLQLVPLSIRDSWMSMQQAVHECCREEASSLIPERLALSWWQEWERLRPSGLLPDLPPLTPESNRNAKR